MIQGPVTGRKGNEYEVEAIVDHEIIEGRSKYYKIRWKGFGPEDDTWESEFRIHCPKLIAKYREEHPDDIDIPRQTKKKKKRPKKNAPLPKERKVKIDERSDYEEPNTDDETQFEVERILDVYHCRDGKREFLIRWKDYSAASDTWEPEANLDCKELIEAFIDKLNRRAEVTERELRVAPAHTQRFTLMEKAGDRRLSKRNSGRQR